MTIMPQLWSRLVEDWFFWVGGRQGDEMRSWLHINCCQGPCFCLGWCVHWAYYVIKKYQFKNLLTKSRPCLKYNSNDVVMNWDYD